MNEANMSSIPRRSGYWKRVLLTAFALTWLSASVHASVVIPPVPLQSGTTVPPNLMFIIDDSGSMQWELTPDDYIYWGRDNGSVFYVFPRANQIYASSNDFSSPDYVNRVATVADGEPFNALARSPQVNTTYYNPSITYRPWFRANGTLYPDASETCAPHNPQPYVGDMARTGRAACIDLTVEQSNYNSTVWVTCNGTGADATCSRSTATQTFWPATYFWKADPASSEWDWSSYEKVEIRSGSSYSGHGRENRTDCTNGTCTYAEEIQNFANWYTYYRSRILASRAGIGSAFAQLNVPTEASSAPRVGFASINAPSRSVDDVTSLGTIITGVRPFVGTSRANWFDQLYGLQVPQQGTPLRRALDDAGQYFSRDDAQGPWNTTPGASGGEILACRQSFSILMTDGYWTHADAARARHADRRADVDSTEGPTIEGPGDRTYRYMPRSPFEDDQGNTLADVAMYYWKNDLLPEIQNRVPTSPQNPAFWQHMVTFGVGLGVTGRQDPDAAFAAIQSGAQIDWDNPVGDGDAFNTAKLDDLLHAAVNSRGGFFSAADPITFAEELTRTLASISERTASGSNVAANSVALRDETRIFQASYVGGQWTGELAAYPITSAGVAANPSWRATDAGNIPPYAQRSLRVFTKQGNSRGTFTSLRGNALGSVNGYSVADYLLGNVEGEARNQGPFRNRAARLGDIVNSSPAYVGDTTPTMLYVGANDGMLHGFNAETGQEVLAYVPEGLSNNKLRALSELDYNHQYYVDGPVTVSSRSVTPDKSILVGTLGRGGKGLYALDVTTPSNFSANNQILWDTGDNTAANGLADWTNEARADLGKILNQVLIARTNGRTGSNPNQNSPFRGPVAIFGNGINSTSGRAALFVVDVNTGALVKHIRVGPVGETGNGITSIRGWDSDGDGIVDHVYAADMKGNIWKFDLDWFDTGRWGVADGFCFQGQCNQPSQARRQSGGNPLIATGQPITGGLQLAFHPETYQPWVMFGTGKYLELPDVSSITQQRWYGVADTGVSIAQNEIATKLTQRNILVQGSIDGTPVRGFQPHAPLPAESRGWFINLQVPPAGQTVPPSERMVSDPLMVGRVLVAASILPSSDPCEAGGTGYLNAVDGFTGTSVAQNFFDVNADGSFDDDVIGTPNGGSVPVGSVNLGVAMPTSPTVVENLLVAGGSRGTASAVGINNPLMQGRVSWREIIGD